MNEEAEQTLSCNYYIWLVSQWLLQFIFFSCPCQPQSHSLCYSFLPCPPDVLRLLPLSWSRLLHPHPVHTCPLRCYTPVPHFPHSLTDLLSSCPCWFCTDSCSCQAACYWFLYQLLCFSISFPQACAAHTQLWHCAAHFVMIKSESSNFYCT